jgi:hypothetical protein
MVRIADINGLDVVRYLKLCDGMFFGGNTWTRGDGFASGIHEMRGLGGILDLVAHIANGDHDHPYTVESSHACRIVIRREMNADQLAAILGCDPQKVHDHFAPLVSLR